MAKLHSDVNPGAGKASAIAFLVGCGLLLGASLLVVTSPTAALTAQQAEASPTKVVRASAFGPGRRLQNERSGRMAKVFGGGGGEGGGGGLIQLIIRLVFWGIYLAIALIFAFVYKSKVVDQIPKMAAKPGSGGGDFKHGLFECCSNSGICLHVWCCTPCRAGHTFHVTDVASYWLVALVLQLLGGCGIGCIAGCIWRGNLRQKLGYQPDAGMDCVKWCFCSPCAAGQEALEIDQEMGVNVACCCNLQMQAPLPTGPAMMGQPVIAQPVNVIGGGGEVIQPKEA